MSSNYFTIIIPTYNSENVLEIALKSIISQSYTEFEVLIIDGLSTDNTLEIARDFHDERIKIFSKKDNGIYDAMNKGIKLAQGEWLYFLGSDDTLFEPSTLQKIYEYIKNSNLEIIYGNVTSSRFKGLYGGEFDNRRIFYQNICHQAIFFKKTVFNTVGGFNLNYKSQADWDHNMKCLSSNISILHVNQIIAEYADGGYSSQGEDIVFQKDKLCNYLLYNRKRMNLAEKIELIYKENMLLIRQRNLKQFLNNILKFPQMI